MEDDLKGVILSFDGQNERFSQSKQALQDNGFLVRRFRPFNHSSPKLQELFANDTRYSKCGFPTNMPMRQKLISNMYSWYTLIQNFADEPSSVSNESNWRFIFEDDIAAVPSANLTNYTQAIRTGMEIAQENGFLYLGICNPTCSSDIKNKGEVIEYAQCSGLCGHAFGLTKWKAKVFVKEMSELCVKFGHIHKRICGNPCIKENFCIDQFLRIYALNLKNIYVVGINLKSPENPTEFGIFYQSRQRFVSTIGI